MACPQLFFGEILCIKQQKRFNLRQNLDFAIPPTKTTKSVSHGFESLTYKENHGRYHRT